MTLPERNIKRAARIMPLCVAYQEALGEQVEPPHRLIVASIMADVRHWCDMCDVDFEGLIRLSYEHWANEQGEEGE